jgi:hypothetical protein
MSRRFCDMSKLSLDDVLKQVTNVREVKPGEYIACCTAHDDKTPSLSITEKSDGTVLLYCHAGCSYKEILASLRTISTDHTGGSSKPIEIVATYDYCDQDGRLLYQKVRSEPKDFRIRRPDGNGGWIWSMGDVKPVLYRLQELLKNDER